MQKDCRVRSSEEKSFVIQFTTLQEIEKRLLHKKLGRE